MYPISQWRIYYNKLKKVAVIKQMSTNIVSFYYGLD